MLTAFLGKKLRQTRIFTADGRQIPVTEIMAGPCTVVAIKRPEKDGYRAIQLGFLTSAHPAGKSLQGHLKPAGQGNRQPRFLREVRTEGAEELPFKVGDIITVDEVLKVGEKVKVTVVSKGKGFQGGVKRHGFAGGPRTHGQSDRERGPGSIGQTTTPGRVYRGKRMAGRMGGKQVTVAGLEVQMIEPTKNTVYITGLVPGGKNSLVYIRAQNA